MTFEQLYNFTVVAKLLNFTKAAETLFISQPTLSRQIATLEQELGAKLFMRDKQKCILTPMGKILLEDSMVLAQNYMKTKNAYSNLLLGLQERFLLPVCIFHFRSFMTLYNITNPITPMYLLKCIVEIWGCLRMISAQERRMWLLDTA